MYMYVRSLCMIIYLFSSQMYFITKYVINIIKQTLFHITSCISPRPISALGPLALWLILVSRADTGCDMEKGMYYSLYIKKSSTKVFESTLKADLSHLNFCDVYKFLTVLKEKCWNTDTLIKSRY